MHTLGGSLPANTLNGRPRWPAAGLHPLCRRSLRQGTAPAPARRRPAAAAAGHAAAGSPPPDGKPRLLLVDGHNLAHRAFHVHQRGAQGPLFTSTGVPTSVSHTFVATLLRMMEAYKPQAAAVAFDVKGGSSFRRGVFAPYKEGRTKPPPEFGVDVDNTVRILRALGILMPSAPEYEADDVIGTIATRAADKGYEVWVFTNDKDMYQLVRPDNSIRILRPANAAMSYSAIQEVDAAGVVDKLGVGPHQVVDYLALVGDSSDAYPGVRGIGEVTARKLLQEFGSITQLMAGLQLVAPRARALLTEGQGDLVVSLQLARLRLDAPLQPPECLEPDSLRLTGADMQELGALLRELELTAHLRKLDNFGRLFGVRAPASAPTPSAPGAAAAASSGKHPAPAPSTAPAAAAAPEAAAPGNGTAAPASSVLPAELARLVDVLQEWERSAGAAWRQYAAGFKAAEMAPLGPQPLVSPAQSPWLPLLPPACAVSVQAPTKLRPGMLTVECCVPLSPGAAPELVGLTLPLEAADPGRSAGAGAAVRVPAEHAAVWGVLAAWLQDPAMPKTLHDAAATAKQLRGMLGVELRGVAVDTVLASYVLSSEAKADMGSLLAAEPDDLRNDAARPPAAGQAASPAAQALQAAQGLLARLRQVPALEQLYFAVEMPLVPVLRQMEAEGVRIDAGIVQQLSTEVNEQLRQVEAKVAAAIEGTPGARGINLSSARDLSNLLFNILKLDTKKSRSTTTGWSTDQKVLSALQGAHPVVGLVQEHRRLAKLRSAYLEQLPPFISPEGRIHTTYNQAAASTGRLSSTEPNLQAIPIKGERGSRLREAFIPRDGWLMASADYSQIELRLLAHLSGEPELVEAFRTGQDVHAATARAITGKQDITAAERRIGKTVNFAVIYGQGPRALSDSLGVPLGMAKTFINKYHQRYARVFQFLEGTKRRVVALGYAESMFGRRRLINFQAEALQKLRGRPLEEVDLAAVGSSIGKNDAAALRAAANAPLQGSSSDIIKLAMLAVHDELARGGFQSRVLLQVHDELVLEVEPSEWPVVRELVRRCMEGVVALSAPLEVNISAAANWLACK